MISSPTPKTNPMQETISRLIYPNPLQPSGVEFTLSRESSVTLKIFGPDGGEVATLLNDARMKAGRYIVGLNTREYLHGVYLYQLTTVAGADRFVETRKLIIAKE